MEHQMTAKSAVKNVVENVPGDELPARFRGAVDPTHRVRVTVEDMEAAPPAIIDRGETTERVLSLAEILSLRRAPYRTTEEIDADLRRDRDAW
jgi:hypothetical protein